MDRVMTITELSSLIPTIFSGKWNDVLRTALPWADSVDFSYEGEISGMGTNLTINQFPDFDEADTLPSATVGSADSVTTTSQNLTINQRPYKDVIVDGIARIQSPDFMVKLRDAMIYSCMKRVDSIISAVYVPSASAPDHQIPFDSSTTLQLADILEGKELLDTADVPAGGRIGILGPAQLNDLFNISEFISRDYNNGSSPITSGQFNQAFCGFNFKMSSRAGNVCKLLHPSMIAAAFQKQLNAGVYDLGVTGARGIRINIDALMGVKQIDDARGVSIS